MYENYMKSNEFVKKIGISLKTLERLEKNNIIIPLRVGRVRYYNEKNEEEYTKYIKSISTSTKKSEIISIIYGNKEFISKMQIEMMSYLAERSIYTDEVLIFTEENIIKDLVEINKAINKRNISELIIIYSDELNYVFSNSSFKCDIKHTIPFNTKEIKENNLYTKLFGRLYLKR